MSRRSGRTDATQTRIVEAWRDAGFSVAITSNAGDGFPDAVVGGRFPCPQCGHKWFGNRLREIKNGELCPSARKLTPPQVKFHATWKGEIQVVSTLEEALRSVGIQP